MSKISKLFEEKYFDLNRAIDKSYMSNGVGCLAVKITDFNDAISRYSGEGYECLNHEFYSYLDRNLRYIPDNVPILLQVYGCKLTEEQKIAIFENIREHYLYKLGEVIEDNKATIRKMLIFIVLALIFCVLFIALDRNQMVSSILNLVFWFYGSTAVTFFASDIRDARKDRIRAAQIANMYITIDEKYDSSPITEEDKKIIYDFLKHAEQDDKTRKNK